MVVFWETTNAIDGLLVYGKEDSRLQADFARLVAVDPIYGATPRDTWKSNLMTVANLPFFRLRSEDPAATCVDEWYSLLTDEVLDKIDCGSRVRTRDVHATLVPIGR